MTTEPTRREAIERLARFCRLNILRYGDSVWIKTTRWKFGYFFDPFTRLDDAMMVAEKIGGLGLEHVPGPGPKYWLASFLEKFIVGPAEAETPAEAITLAALAYLDATEKTK